MKPIFTITLVFIWFVSNLTNTSAALISLPCSQNPDETPVIYQGINAKTGAKSYYRFIKEEKENKIYVFFLPLNPGEGIGRRTLVTILNKTKEGIKLYWKDKIAPWDKEVYETFEGTLNPSGELELLITTDKDKEKLIYAKPCNDDTHCLNTLMSVPESEIKTALTYPNVIITGNADCFIFRPPSYHINYDKKSLQALIDNKDIKQKIILYQGNNTETGQKTKYRFIKENGKPLTLNTYGGKSAITKTITDTGISLTWYEELGLGNYTITYHGFLKSSGELDILVNKDNSNNSVQKIIAFPTSESLNSIL